MTKRIRVELLAIKCDNIPGDKAPGGEEIELFGELYAKRTNVNELGVTVETLHHTFWSRPENDPMDIQEPLELTGAAPELSGRNVVEVNIDPEDTLSFGGELWEEDEDIWVPIIGYIEDDDYMRGEPHNFVEMSYDTLRAGPHKLKFSEGGQEVSVRFNTKVL
jgi:hypothetical protein